jgi:hypothetical protein
MLYFKQRLALTLSSFGTAPLHKATRFDSKAKTSPFKITERFGFDITDSNFSLFIRNDCKGIFSRFLQGKQKTFIALFS